MARTAKRYKKNTEKKISGIPVCMAAIYARLSVDNDEKKSESIETQVTLIKEFIQKHNENPDRECEIVVYDIYSDLGKTGTNFDRPGFERMMNDVRAGKINCILVKDFSRFGRNYIETGNYLEKILPFMKVRFISVCDNYDSFAPGAKNQELSMNIKNLVNDAYAKDISAKCCASKRACQKNGSYVGGMAPYGYHSVNENGIRKLVIDPETAEIVRRIFEQFLQTVCLSIGLLTGFLRMVFIGYPIITDIIMCTARMEKCFINGEILLSGRCLPEIIIMEIWYSISINPGFLEERNGVILWMKGSGLSLPKRMSRLSAEICLIRHKSG